MNSRDLYRTEQIEYRSQRGLEGVEAFPVFTDGEMISPPWDEESIARQVRERAEGAKAA